MGRIFNLLFNRYSNCTVLLRIGTLNIKPVGVCRIKGFVKKQLRMFYWAWHNKLKNAVIYLIRQTSREKCKLFSWSVRDLIMMKVPATKTVKTFIHKNKYVNVKMGSVLRNSTIVIHANVIFIESNISCIFWILFYFKIC